MAINDAGNIRKITFSNATPKAIDHGALFAAYMADGIIDGCAIGYNSGNFSITTGWLVAAGRLMHIETSDDAIAVSGTGVARLKLTINTTNAANETIEVTVQTASTEADLPILAKNDINTPSGGVYEIELGLANISNGTLIRSIGKSVRPIFVTTDEPMNTSPEGIYLVVG